MSKTNGEGRSSSEKSGRLIETPEAREARLDALRREEAEWAAKCGPVTVRKKSD